MTAKKWPAAVFGIAAVLLASGCRTANQSKAKTMPDKAPQASIPAGPAEDGKPKNTMPPLTEEERRIIVGRGTERPFTGKYWNTFDPGVYVCRQCGARLYASTSKFASSCGWPSFDDEIPGAVTRRPDPDGQRTEIVCSACGGHLGHVFEGEGLTPNNIRHCVNSASLVFRPAGQADMGPAATMPATTRQAASPKQSTEQAVFAGGCFWGVEHYFRQVDGVISVISGYTGGTAANPTYEQVCTGSTGHAEAVRVVFDPARASYERLARLFFEIHDPTQLNRQGPDVRTQYRSAVFYADQQQKTTAEKLISELLANGCKAVTQVLPASEFYPAELYHQDYLTKHPGLYDCHVRVPRFETPNK